MNLAVAIARPLSGERESSAHHPTFCANPRRLQGRRKPGHGLMVFFHDARKCRSAGSHCSKPVAPPLCSTRLHVPGGSARDEHRAVDFPRPTPVAGSAKNPINEGERGRISALSSSPQISLTPCFSGVLRAQRPNVNRFNGFRATVSAPPLDKAAVRPATKPPNSPSNATAKPSSTKRRSKK